MTSSSCRSDDDCDVASNSRVQRPARKTSSRIGMPSTFFFAQRGGVRFQVAPVSVVVGLLRCAARCRVCVCVCERHLLWGECTGQPAPHRAKIDVMFSRSTPTAIVRTSAPPRRSATRRPAWNRRLRDVSRAGSVGLLDRAMR